MPRHSAFATPLLRPSPVYHKATAAASGPARKEMSDAGDRRIFAWNVGWHPGRAGLGRGVRYNRMAMDAATDFARIPCRGTAGGAGQGWPEFAVSERQ